MPRCSFCRHRAPGKPASAYIALFPSPGTRKAFKIKAGMECVEHFRQMLAAFLASPMLGEVDIDTCRACGITLDASDTYTAYLTLYVPGAESQLFEAIYCDACYVHFFDRVSDLGEVLPDRQPETQSARASVAAWDSLGLNPNGSAA